MIGIDKIEEQFGIEGELGFSEISEEIFYVTISNKYADAEISLYGAQIMHYRPLNTFDVLWMSPVSEFEAGKPIRGGIPVCFPWFAKHPLDTDLPLHGFVRLMNWEVIETRSLPEGETLLRMQVVSDEETKRIWPFEFIAEIKIIVGKKLLVDLTIKNTDSQPFEYSSALHTYYNVSAIHNIAIEGLKDTAYFDSTDANNYRQEESLLRIDREVNRVYSAGEDCILYDPPFNRKIIASKQNSKTTVVWNPWENCKNFSDLEEDSYETYVCIEAVNAFEDKILLSPGNAHTLSAMISIDH